MYLNAWQRFYFNFKQDLKLWIYCIVFFQVCRITYVWGLRSYIATNSTWVDIVSVMFHGARYDSVWSTVFVFIPLLLITVPSIFISHHKTALLARKIRVFLGAAYTVIAMLSYMIGFEYYKEYRDFFNQFLFGLIYDDIQAILSTIWTAYHPHWYLTLMMVGLVLYFKYFSRWCVVGPTVRRSVPRYLAWQKFIITLGIVVFYIGAFRGGLGPRPVQLKDAGVTKDSFLNKAVVSPLSALRYAINDHNRVLNDSHGYHYFSKAPIEEVLRQLFPTASKHHTIDAYLERKVIGHNNKKPKHIFVIVGESYDAWSFQSRYQQLGLVEKGKQLGKEGLYLKPFLSAADGTAASLSTIITGLPDAGVLTNYQPSANSAFPTAPAMQFKKLGYKTRFFYGGYLSWQRIGDFAAQQGFESVYGAPHIANWHTTSEWGVDDRSLFNFILSTLQDDVPSYNVIMTTSNHPPFSIDLNAEGFDSTGLQQALKAYPDSPATLKQLGHLWYADKTVYEFVKQAETILERPLFAITGDHFGRRHVLPNPPIFDMSTVPLILYGKEVLAGMDFPEDMAGSHLDIGVTLLELTAPRGFSYHALGHDLFRKRALNWGLGRQRIITASQLSLIQGATEMIGGQQSTHILQLKEMYNRIMAVTWWRIMRGNQILE